MSLKMIFNFKSLVQGLYSLLMNKKHEKWNFYLFRMQSKHRMTSSFLVPKKNIQIRVIDKNLLIKDF